MPPYKGRGHQTGMSQPVGMARQEVSDDMVELARRQARQCKSVAEDRTKSAIVEGSNYGDEQYVASRAQHELFNLVEQLKSLLHEQQVLEEAAHKALQYVLRPERTSSGSTDQDGVGKCDPVSPIVEQIQSCVRLVELARGNVSQIGNLLQNIEV